MPNDKPHWVQVDENNRIYIEPGMSNSGMMPALQMSEARLPQESDAESLGWVRTKVIPPPFGQDCGQWMDEIIATERS